MNLLMFAMVTGVVATALMDLWAVIRKRLLDIPHPDYALVGRWLAHMVRGQFRHRAIAAAPPVRGERLIGWSAHYLTGIAFALLLLGIRGPAWAQRPSIGAALAVGLGMVSVPFFLMQPGMGAGMAGSRTPRPTATRLQSLATHAVFGLGLYAGGLLADRLCGI